MAKITAIVNQKGGTGKTTTTVNLGAALAELGKFVLIVDFDPQGNASSGLGVNLEEKDGGIYEALAGQKSITEVIKKTNRPGFDIIPPGPNLAAANVELVNLEEREYRLKQTLLGLRSNYDYVLVDCPPSLGLLTINALVAADDVLIPVQCEYYALEGLGQLLQTVDLVKQNLQPSLDILGVLLTMFQKRIRLFEDVRSEVEKNFPYRVFKTVIPRTVRLAEAPSFGKSILEQASWSKGARAYRSLAKEFVSCAGQALINTKQYEYNQESGPRQGSNIVNS